MTKTVKAASKKTKTVVAPVKEFVAGQLAYHDVWDDGRGNSTTRTVLVRVRSIEPSSNWGPFGALKPAAGALKAVVVLENGSVVVVGFKSLRHLPEVFNGATIGT